ncbi:MAG: hypothetical protein EWM51_04345 [Treponema sp.]|nr:MAG: hypothetical protein EWM51_04345 [Treponema sp.]
MNMTHRTRDLGHKTATAAFLLIAFLLLAGCEQPTDADTDDAASKLPAGITLATATPATAESILGSWKMTDTWDDEDSAGGEFTVVEEETLNIESDGSFLTFSKRTTTSKTDETKIDYWYSAEKGTYTFVEGVITRRSTNWYSSINTFDPLELSADQWNLSDYDESDSITILDGKLCFNPLKRVGTGTGLIGTWSIITSHPEDDGMRYYKQEWSFTETTITITNYESTTTTFGEAKGTQTVQYTLPGNNKLSLTYDGGSLILDILFTGDLLVVGTGNIYTKVNP